MRLRAQASEPIGAGSRWTNTGSLNSIPIRLRLRVSRRRERSGPLMRAYRGYPKPENKSG
jgi:hypothetical protein